MKVDLTFDEFTRHVHAERKAGVGESLTDALIWNLQLVKPLLAKASLDYIDPRTPPYQLTLWLEFVRNNWSEYDRPKTESM